MKKIAFLLALCLLIACTAAYAEEAPTREVWRGEVTAVGEDALTLKIIEYAPEAPKLPAPEQPEETPSADAPATPKPQAPAALSGQKAPEFDAPIGSVSVPVTEQTRYFTCAGDVFTEAAFEDIAIGDVLTVEIIDGAAQIAVIETDAKTNPEIGM